MYVPKITKITKLFPNGSEQWINCGSLAEIPQTETASLPTADRRLIRRNEMQRRIAAAAKSRAPHTRKISLS